MVTSKYVSTASFGIILGIILHLNVIYTFDLAPGMMKGVKEANKLKKQLEKLKELQEIQRLKIEIEQKKREGIPINPAQLTDGTVPGQPGQPPASVTMANTNNVTKTQSRSRSRSYTRSRSRSRSYSSESRLLRSPSRSPLQSGFHILGPRSPNDSALGTSVHG